MFLRVVSLVLLASYVNCVPHDISNYHREKRALNFGSSRGSGSNYFNNNPYQYRSLSSSGTSLQSSPQISPNLSPVNTRRSSFQLDDGMAALNLNTPTNQQLAAVKPWERRNINIAGLNDNCYFCTASGLSGRTTHQMVQNTQTMQERTGPIQSTLSLLHQSGHPRAQAYQFQNSNQMNSYLNNRLQPGTSGQFGMAYTNGDTGPGHMVAVNGWRTHEGNLGTRVVDFQLPPNQRQTQPMQLNPPGRPWLIDLNPVRPMNQWRP